MTRTLFQNCRVWDGSGAASYPADVLVDGDRIHTIATARGQLDTSGADVIEANGMTLMPADELVPRMLPSALVGTRVGSIGSWPNPKSDRPLVLVAGLAQADGLSPLP